ncbi:hypothetical protein [Thiocystis violascens]|uniref:Uncharacterized protein n=1 Tax=Thiocystis violascens (strain ATCC 17096 / DSM 198 / 6111) TaxID=765911 RepID=I3YB72_THIV6|nr:hypothetical protein [Thiocystis violascens]AFL74240.1 hypothetical protein Thivi_2293 [Thiocystis violascens DSM 198]
MGLCSKPDKASDVAKKGGGDKKIDDPKKPCPLAEEANIVSIAWLDGGDDKEVATATQWVNLPMEDQWVNGAEIKNKDRLGMKPRLKVKFDKPGSHSFKVKLLAPTGTAAYTATEKARNPNFNHTEDEKSYTTDADGTKIIANDVQLVAGGGYKFKAEAKDSKGKKVTTGELTTKRLFYYVEAKMTGLASVLSSTAPIDSEYAKHHIVLKQLSALSITRQTNIGNDTDSGTLSGNVNTAIDASATVKAKKPYLLAVAYTDHLAVKNANVTISKQPVEVGPGKPKVVIPVVARGLLAPNAVETRYLWHDLVPGESWFVEAKFHRDGGGVTDIPAAKVTHKGTGDYWDEVEIDVTGLAVGRGRIDVKVNVVDRMRGGLALGGANQVCVCTRAWWSNQPDAKQECTIIHEIGHKLDMVVKGSGKQPDAVATHYSGKGHAGDHCYQGCPAGEASYNTAANLSASQCVIFGAVNQKNAFCANCEKAVKKLDINSGW